LEKHAGYVSAAIGKWHLGYNENHQESDTRSIIPKPTQKIAHKKQQPFCPDLCIANGFTSSFPVL